MQSDRLNLPSASKFEILAACEGQANLERQVREIYGIVEQPDAWAERGTRIHKAWETDDISPLAGDELSDLIETKERDMDATGQWLQEKNLALIKSENFSERRLWLHDAEMNPIVSGQFDKLTICGTHAYVRDLKSGWCKRLSPSQQSWQLRLLAVLVWQNFQERGLETIRASFVRPKLRSVDTVEYSLDDLYRSLTAIKQILWRSSQPDAKRTPGEHCYYCPCKPHCAEAGAMAMLPSVIARNTGLAKKADVIAAVERLQPSDWKKIWSMETVTKTIFDASKKCLKQMPASQLSEIGLQIKEGRRLDPIVNTIGAYKAFEHSLPPEKLWACLEFSKTALVEAVQAHRKITKKEAEQVVRDTLEPFIEKKNAEGSLEEI